VRSEPAPARTKGIKSWSARCSSTGTTGFEPGFCSLDSGHSDFLCRTATFTEAGEDPGHVPGFNRQNYGIPRPDGILDRLDGAFVFMPLEFVAKSKTLTNMNPTELIKRVAHAAAMDGRWLFIASRRCKENRDFGPKREIGMALVTTPALRTRDLS
jgi:hypothetical protein